MRSLIGGRTVLGVELCLASLALEEFRKLLLHFIALCLCIQLGTLGGNLRQDELVDGEIELRGMDTSVSDGNVDDRFRDHQRSFRPRS